jgi:hypothetical protein
MSNILVSFPFHTRFTLFTLAGNYVQVILKYTKLVSTGERSKIVRRLFILAMDQIGLFRMPSHLMGRSRYPQGVVIFVVIFEKRKPENKLSSILLISINTLTNTLYRDGQA